MKMPFAKTSTFPVRSTFRTPIVAMEPLDPRRLLSGGTLDPTFGTGGLVTDVSLPTALAMAVQSDGKVVEAGMILNNFELARFNANGTPDTTFGYLGRLVTDIGGVDKPTGMAIQPDGKILVSGLSSNKFALARYKPDGQLDTTFGTGGIATIGFGAADLALSAKLALRPDGKILVVGAGGPSVNPINSGNDFIFAGFNANGTPDYSFHFGGTYIVPHSSMLRVENVALQPDLKFIVIGNDYPTGDGGGIAHSLVQRFNVDATLDPTPFAGSGAGFEIFTAIAIQGDGKVLLGGNADASPILIRDNATGTIDAGFISTGPLAPSGMILQFDGKIIAVGGAFDIGPAIERLNADGSLDASYGTGGTTSTFGGGLGLIAAGPAGTTVLAGGPSELHLARYTPSAFGESPFNVIPVQITDRIEAENFNNGGEGIAYHSSNPINYTANLYRTSGVSIESSGDTGGGFNVGYLHAGDYLRYFTTAAAGGNFTLTARVANPAVGGAFHVEVDGVNVTGNLNIPVTPSWQTYEDVTSPAFAVGGGPHVIRLVMDANNTFGFAGNFNYLTFTPAGASTGSVSGTVYQDLNGNGVRDAGEGPSANQQVYLDIPGIGHYVAGDPATLSDAGGHYTLGGLAAANYLVRFTTHGHNANPAGRDLRVSVLHPARQRDEHPG